MRILITGASGLLGSKVAELAAGAGHDVYSGYLTHAPSHGIPIKLDVRDEASLRKAFERYRPEVVIHAAALTDVDKCEIERGLAWEINVGGTRNVARLSREYGAFLIYISTDYVFRGDRGMYREEDERGPVNYYGLTKLEGEDEVMRSAGEYCIVRPSVIYGARPASGKANFALWVLGKLGKGEEVDVAADQWASPTLSSNLAEMVLEVAERRLSGIYHLAGATRASRYDFAKMLARAFGLDERLVRPTTMDKIGWVARRPRDSSLDVSKAMRDLRNKPLPLDIAVMKLREELRAGKSY